MFLKYLDLHNKILRDAVDPLEVANDLVKNGYCVVGVNVHSFGNEVKNKEHYYKFFETHFEMFEKKGLLILPAVELKIRDGNYSVLGELIKEFSRKFIPIHHNGNIYQVPFLIFIHGGKKEANEISSKISNVDLLCHPKKDEGYFDIDTAQAAFDNNIGIELNFREFRISENRDSFLEGQKEILKICHEVGNKLFLFSAIIREENLVHINELIEYGKLLREDLVSESIKNVKDLIMQKYEKLLCNINFDMKSIHSQI